MAFDALKEFYKTGKKKAQELINDDKELIGWIAVVLVVATIVIVFGWSIGAEKTSRSYRFGQALAIFWAIAPPVYFFVEWWFWAPKKAEAGLDERKFEFEQFKYTQEIATKFWVGFAGGLALLFLASK
jgi:hypothetical protein